MQVIKSAEKMTHQRDRAVTETVLNIIDNVRTNGDQTLLELASKFDHTELESVRVSREEIEAAYQKVSPQIIEELKFSARQIEFFARQQLACLKPLNTTGLVAGLELGHCLVPVDKCGCYIPSGRYPLPSSALMSIITAKTAGVKQVAACSPPFAGVGGIHPVVLAAMDIAGADVVYCMGGAQAIAAYAYGTQLVDKVDLIVGPGNKYVTEAKRQVLGDVGIDSLAGPSEVLIIADSTAKPQFVAIDLLAQAEHDPNAKSILLSTSVELIEAVQQEVVKLAESLPTGEVARQSWLDNGEILLAADIEEAVAYSNKVAPEHLELQLDPQIERQIAGQLLHYGSLFVGHYAPVAFGDFVSGTNHILPTSSTARFSSGLWVGSFIKTAFYQFVSSQGCSNLAEHCMRFAETEGLAAHRDSVRLRAESINGEN